MIVAKHTAEMCPGGIVKPDREFLKKLEEAAKKAGVNVVGSYLDAPGHTYYLVIETDSNDALNNAVEPLRLIGDVSIVPVMKLLDAAAWAKKIGIQK